jgi:hypothetical protein
MTAGIDRAGKRFGAVTILDRAPSKGRGWVWRYRCDCGAEGVCRSSRIPQGGCPRCSKERHDKAVTKHGNARSGKRTDLYQCWLGIRQRCFNENNESYPHYGGRGITVSPRWDDFEVFAADIPPRPSAKHQLDRIDNNGNYEPGNVRWATCRDNNRNRRSNRMLTFNGQTLVMKEWAEKVGLPYTTLKQRIANGWDARKALTTPWLPRGERWRFGSAQSNPPTGRR